MAKTIVSDIVMQYFLPGLSETFTKLKKCWGFLSSERTSGCKYTEL